MNLRLRIPPPIWLLLFGSLMWGLHRLMPFAQLVRPPVNRVGWLLVVAGAATIITAMLQFRRAHTTVNPLAPSKASALVISGIFGYSRNPMYLGLAVILCGWAVVLGSLGPWAALPLFTFVITRLQVEPEEAALTTIFGATYADYCVRVGRWFGRKG